MKYSVIDRKSIPVHESITLVAPGDRPKDECFLRPDDTGILNGLKAWYLFLLHSLICGFSVFSIIQWVDNRNFHTGSPPSIFAYKSGLYQTQVTGLISLALVGIRLLAGSCTALLAWRVIFILLEKRGISLAEITRLTTRRVPIFPGFDSRTQALWSCWTTVVIFLLWPSSFAAPLVSSSVAWLPSTRISGGSTQIELDTISDAIDGSPFLYPEKLYQTVVSSATMTGKDPSYVFNSTNLPLRRYFDSTLPEITAKSAMNLVVPYFDVKIKWVDNTTVANTSRIADWKYMDVNNNSFVDRSTGSVAIIRDEQFDPGKAVPIGRGIWRGTKLVSVLLRTMNKGDILDDGTIVGQYTPCPTRSELFGELPHVGQYQNGFVLSTDKSFLGMDCYILGEASITAGAHTGVNCTVSPASSIDRYATCETVASDAAVEEDWLRELALDFMSESLKYTSLQNFTGPWMNRSIDEYTTAMLTLGYHAAWSGLMNLLGNSSEPATFNQAEPVVRAEIEKSKLYGWLGMNASLLVAAILVYIAQTTSTTKTVRSTAIAAMTMDLTEITHSGRAKGLCNAVALSKQDRKLPKLRWKDFGTADPVEMGPHGETIPLEGRACRRRVVFADEYERPKRGGGNASIISQSHRSTGYERL